jgi:hypothetical protein
MKHGIHNRAGRKTLTLRQIGISSLNLAREQTAAKSKLAVESFWEDRAESTARCALGGQNRISTTGIYRAGAGKKFLAT